MDRRLFIAVEELTHCPVQLKSRHVIRIEGKKNPDNIKLIRDTHNGKGKLPSLNQSPCRELRQEKKEKGRDRKTFLHRSPIVPSIYHYWCFPCSSCPYVLGLRFSTVNYVATGTDNKEWT